MTAPTTTAPTPDAPPRPDRPPAPRPVVLGALLVGAAAALLVPGGPPGVGLVLVAAISAAVVVALRRGAPAPSRWQVVHGTAALLLVAAAGVRDAPWLVALDLVAAAPLLALALAPARSWTAVLTALPRLALRTPGAAWWLARGVRPLAARGGPLGPLVRGLVLTALVLVVFVPLLASADTRFAALVDRLPALPELPLADHAVALVLGAVAAAAALATHQGPPPELVLPRPARHLRRTSEWLLPLGALGLLLATFLAVQATQPVGAATFSERLHEGFSQLVAVTALVLLVVAAAVRWTPATRGVRAALGVLCLLTLAVDASALVRLVAYVDAYGLTRLRVGVGVISLALGAVLVVVLVAGCRRGPQRWVPHAVVLVCSVAMVTMTVANPDAAIARSGVAQGADVDTAYLATLSADAVPALLALDHPQRACVLGAVRARLPEAGWTSANLARTRAERLLPDAAGTAARQRGSSSECLGARNLAP